ncbi:hypothetical protein ABK040_002950 [Willaertia magna]
MYKNSTQKLLQLHTIKKVGHDLLLKMNQTLTQDATGTLVMLSLEKLNPTEIKTNLSVQYCDHNLLRLDEKNHQDHEYLRTMCAKYGVYFSPPGNGISHIVHFENFSQPKSSLVGSDSHTCNSGAMNMLALGAGGLDVSLAIVGQPIYLKEPKVFGIELKGELPDWVSAKDIILELLRRYGVKGANYYIIEYYGDGLKRLTCWDRMVLANMGCELGAVTTVFPCDEETLKKMNEMKTIYNSNNNDNILDNDIRHEYDKYDSIDLSKLEPLIATPHSPGNVVPVSELTKKENIEIFQSYIGSSANPGLRDFYIGSYILSKFKDQFSSLLTDRISLDINPTSRHVAYQMSKLGITQKYLELGSKIHIPGCNGCIGMGQSIGEHYVSLRTTPRNFKGRSGTKEDMVYLCSPETAMASAIKGKVTDPRELGLEYPKKELMELPIYEPSFASFRNILEPLSKERRNSIMVKKGSNIKPLPDLDKVPYNIEGPVILKVEDNISIDEIIPTGSQVIALRSNIYEISKYTFKPIDDEFYEKTKDIDCFFIVGGSNYGQGSSREHAAIALRYLGLRVLVAKSIARIHLQNLLNFGVLPLIFENEEDYDKIDEGDKLSIKNVRSFIENIINGEDNQTIRLQNLTKHTEMPLILNISSRQAKSILYGSLINMIKEEKIL